ncbi:MAG TPA: signal peptidase I [Anaerolineales bacterium]|nr:signal peptidase I [Anaerolineales bacterium]
METTQPDIQPNTDPLGQETDDWKRFALDIIETIVLAVILYFGINAISARVRVDGFSMNPTLQNGEYVLVNRLTYKLNTPERGDIIVFTIPTDQQQELIKRVIGLPGETVSVRQNEVLINDRPLEEPYIAQAPLYSGEWIVPEGHLFVLGDNRNGSSDSHQWGVLPMENVIGKALIIYWPPPEWKLINHTDEVFGQLQIQDTVR